MVYANEGGYEGNWVTDELDGIGIYTWTNGDVYDGHWKGGRRAGGGGMIRANGVKYVGGWMNHTANGKGVLTDGKGKVIFEGRWKDGLFYFIIYLIIFYIFVYMLFFVLFFVIVCCDFCSFSNRHWLRRSCERGRGSAWEGC
jgi:hypothetical protein